MGIAQPVQQAIAGRDADADPAVGAVIDAAGAPRGGAGVDDLREGGVAGHSEPLGLQHLGQRAGQVQAVQRDDRPFARFDPHDFGVVARFGHWKDAAAIGKHQQFGIDHVMRVFGAAAIAHRAR